jgi:hypothetical protein
MTMRLNQPWKTGLPIDFTRNKMPKYFGLIPREQIHRILGKMPTRYMPHPNKEIEKLFFDIASRAYENEALTDEIIVSEIEKKHIRPDFLKKMSAH